MPVITPDDFPDEVKPRVVDEFTVSQDASSGQGASCGLSSVASSPGAGLPDLVKRLLQEESTNVYAEATEYVERFVITEVLRSTDGNQSRAAEILGITRGKLRDRITSFKITLKSNVEMDSGGPS